MSLSTGCVMNTFDPLYYKDRLMVVNPQGVIGVVTLWSKPDWVYKKLSELSIDLSDTSSAIAVIGTLYGNGLPHLLRNLLYNPQITVLVCCGRNRSQSLEDLLAFFAEGVEQINGSSPFVYQGKNIPAVRIKGRRRILDSLVLPEDFSLKPTINRFGELRDEESLMRIKNFFSEFDKWNASTRDSRTLLPRRKIPFPTTKIEQLPCNPRAFVVVKKDVVSAWEELVFVLYRFGRTAHLPKGDRKELQNIKVVVEEPTSEIDERLFDYWFIGEQISRYQREILSKKKQSDEVYTYGHRLRSYFGKDTLIKVAERLLDDKEDRKCFISLWDTKNDLEADDQPCLVTLFFRFYDEKLTLSATFRAHNSLDAWISNFYGLKAVLDFVAERSSLGSGSITVFSHSISIDMDETSIARAELLVKSSRRFSMNQDPQGEIAITVDRDRKQIVLQHSSKDGLLIKEYRNRKAEKIQHELYRDMALSDLNHAMYVGRQLAKAEAALKKGVKFIQD
jgi:thymidylate synthase